MTFTSLDRLNKAIIVMHNAGLGKIKCIVIIRDIAAGYGFMVSLSDAKALVDAVWALNGWDASVIN